MSCRASSASPPRQSQSGAGLPGPAQSGVGAGSALSSGFQPLSPGPRSPCHPAMDAALALQVGEAVAEKVLRYRRDESGWRTCRQGDGVSVSWRPSVEFPGNLYRGEGIVDGTPGSVWDCVKPLAGSLREKWDENVTSFEVIQSFTDTLCITRTATPSAAMRLISPRDFVDLVLVRKYEDGTISSNASNVEHALCPPKPGYVRGFNHPCGCFCEPVPGEPNKTKVVTFFQTDLSGYLPQSVVDAFFPRSMAGLYANLQKAVRSPR